MHTGAVQLVFKHTILCPEVLFKICQIPINPPIHQSNLYWKSDDYVLEEARIEDYLIQYHMGVKPSHTTRRPCLQQHTQSESAGNAQLLTTW